MNISDKILRAKADLDSVYEAGVEKGKAEGGGGLTPSEGLEFQTTYDAGLMRTYLYGWKGLGTCTDTEIVVPCAEPGSGIPVVSVGVRNNKGEIVSSVWLGNTEKIYLPDTICRIEKQGFMGGAQLKYIKFGRYLNGISANQFSYTAEQPTDLVLDFSDFALNTVPTLEDSSLLTGVSKIIVPYDMLINFKLASNWALAADKIVDPDGNGNAIDDQAQTWVLNDTIYLYSDALWEVPFSTLGNVSGGSEFVGLEIVGNADLNYITADGTRYTMYSTTWGGVWGPPDYNVLMFTTALPDDLVAWLAANGTQVEI